MFIVETIFGYLALITSLIGLLPQSLKAYKTQSTQDVSMLMVLNYLLCSLAWIIYGTCISSGFVVASNVVCFLSSILLIAQKRYYDNAG